MYFSNDVSKSLSEEKKDDLFFGKSVCISSHFQKNRFNEFLAIIERLYSFGATYTGKASVSDIFIEYQDGEEEEIRFASVKQAEETENKTTQVLSLEDTLRKNKSTAVLVKTSVLCVSAVLMFCTIHKARMIEIDGL